jgi:DDE family transposase
MNFRYSLRLYAVAAICITLLACSIPMVLILCKPKNWVRVPKTGSTVLCRLDFIYLPRLLFTLAMARSYSSPKEHSSQHNGLFDMQIFEYDNINDCYSCPAGEILSTNATVYNKAGHKVKHYKNRQACKTCTLRAQCTTNKNGRFIERSIYQEALEENQKRVEDNPEYYRMRQQITEHQFGTLKRQWGFTFTLMKGKEHVLSEVNLMMICYNLRRLMSIFPVNELKSRLKALLPVFLRKYALFLCPISILIAEIHFSLFQNPHTQKHVNCLILAPVR